MEQKEQKCCGCPCHKVSGILIVLIGLAFLLGALDVLSQRIVQITWPILVMLYGLKNSFGKGRCKCCEKA